MKTYKNLVFILVTVLAILIQLTNPTLAYADDGAPTQPADSATEVAPPQEPVATEPPIASTTEAAPTEEAIATEAATEAAPTEEAVPTEAATEPAPTELPAATEAPTVKPAPDDNSDPTAVPSVIDEPTMTEVVQQISADTDIVVVDDTGEVVPLATQEAAEIIASSDPVWCPAGKKPGDTGCSSSYTSLNALLTGIGTTINSDGTIWITSGTVAETGPVLIDGSIYTNWAGHALTLQGAWDGTSAGTITTTNSTFNVPISITNWTGSVTVNDITIENAAGTGLEVTTAGNIELNNITVTGGGTYGAYLDNTSSPSSATVTIGGTNTFNGNQFAGLYVLSNGNITANNVTANNSTNGRGVNLINTSGTGNVTLTGTNVFNSNYRHGLYVRSHGIITLENITANGSIDDTGIDLDNRATTHPDVILKGTYELNNNFSDGLFALTSGNITINNITASENTLFRGVYIDNTSGTGDITLSGINTFVHNGNAGLFMTSNGNVSLENVTATNNGWIGAYLPNTGSATISNSVFNQNGDTGLYLGSNGNVTLNNVTANDNSNAGVFTASNNNITINSITSINNRCVGLHIVGSNKIYINSGTIQGNTFGILIDNSTHTYHLDPDVIVSGNIIDFTGRGAICETAQPGEDITSVFTVPVQSQSEFTFDCASQSYYPVTLPNGDQVTIFCPVSGKALIKRLDNTMLPADLPAGYTYASAFSLDIFQGQGPIPVITEGGNIKASFHVPSLEAGASYSILYWDNGTWIPLKEFILDENGKPRSFELYPDDPRVILSGLNFDFSGASPRVEVSTNFPGVFVLAQH